MCIRAGPSGSSIPARGRKVRRRTDRATALSLHAYGLLSLAGVAQGGEGAALAPGLEAGIVDLRPLALGRLMDDGAVWPR